MEKITDKRGKLKTFLYAGIGAIIAMLLIAISPQSLSPPSARTNHKPTCQSAYQPSLSAAHKALYRVPFSHYGIFSAVRAFVDEASSTNFSVEIRTMIKEYLACTNETEK